MRVGIVTDIHEDALRLGEALLQFEKRNCDVIACLGDISGFDVLYYRYLSTRSSSKCISMIRSNCKYVVTGNHDLFSIRKIPNYNGIFNFPKEWYDLDYTERVRLSERRVWLFENQELSTLMTREEKEYISSLPEYIITEFDGFRILFSHSIFPDPTGSLIWRPKNPWDFNQHFEFLKKNNCHFGFSGHLHPNGYGKANENDYSFHSFGLDYLSGFLVQYISPCVANSANKNGYLIIDFRNKTVESIKLKSKRYQLTCFT